MIRTNPNTRGRGFTIESSLAEGLRDRVVLEERHTGLLPHIDEAIPAKLAGDVFAFADAERVRESFPGPAELLCSILRHCRRQPKRRRATLERPVSLL